MNWVAEELWDVDLGDARRNRRLVKIVEDLVAQPGSPKKVRMHCSGEQSTKLHQYNSPTS
ncbi:hypothetical protein H6F90_01110 [Trichocoleus sp. FACHB-591]|uniref:IS4/Tn5 family transposase DNA-binding protein n=1 Tax=Trichocoleus sp. FACHB-591 TaxID=2692872 RepID=UPI00168579A3|nr:hypothetical protein [Trichocoleus sp. FACHB-591]